MRTSYILSALALGTTFAVGGAALAPALAQTSHAALAAEARQGPSIAEVHERLAALGYSNIDKIEREGRTIEVRATEPNGERVKLRVDALTGDVVDTRIKRKRDRDAERSEPFAKHVSFDQDEIQSVSAESMGWYLQDIYQRMRAGGI